MSQPAAPDKAYNPLSVQKHVADKWSAAHTHHATPDPSKPPYAIVIPPPNVTAALHMGHALNNTIQDILIRHHRMLGDNTCWIPGTDHAGIATQTVVEKRVLQEEGLRRADFKDNPKAFVDRIWKWKDEYEVRITHQLKEMGCSCDWDRQRFTMDEVCAAAVREAFFKLFQDGLIYRGKRLVNWDPVTQTALADDEVEMREVDGNFYYLRYPLVHPVGEQTHITVATTRPETMLGDTAIAVNPADPARKHLIGQSVRLPIVNRVIPIIGDDYVVIPDPESSDPKAKFASGFLKVTPAHDPNDYDIGLRHKLPIINVMGPDASISITHGWPQSDHEQADLAALRPLLSLSREDARKAIVRHFKDHGLLEEIKPYRHAVGHSYRSHVPIEPYLSDQWYVSVTDDRLRGAALRAMAPEQFDTSTATTPGGQGQLRFFPARYARTFQTWHENIRDWCISRQLWWGHRIPVWYVRAEGGSVGPTAVQDIYKHRNEWFERFEAALNRLATDEFVVRRDVEAFTCTVCTRTSRGDDLLTLIARSKIKLEPGAETQYISFPGGDETKSIALDLGDMVLSIEQDPDVLDTWFSSGLWPISTLGWPDPGKFVTDLNRRGDEPKEPLALDTWNPSSTLCTAREIITLWVSRMVMFNLYLNRDRLPFKDVFIHAMIQDGEGQKMSKSLGNGVDPLDVIHTHGADAMRFTLAAMTTQTQDVRMPVDVICPHTGQSFTPKKIRTSSGHVVAAPIQESPGDPSKKMVTSYGYSSGQAKPTDDMPLARNTSSKFDQGRNFANKLWNAGRFVMSKLSDGVAPEPLDAASLPLADRWILHRLARTITAANAALAGYEFKNYADALYDFFWRDYCDWYLEAIKPIVGEAGSAGQASRTVAAVCLNAALRLIHPVMPFISEGLWEQLGQTPLNAVPRIHGLSLPPADLCMLAPWPKAEASLIDDTAERQFTMLQDLVAAIRNIRNQYNVAPRQVTPIAIKATGPVSRIITDTAVILTSLSASTLQSVGPDVQPGADAATAVVGEVEIYVQGLVDPDAERTRLSKRLEELTRSRAALAGRLNNPGYSLKAPPHLVQQTRDQLADLERELQTVEAKLQSL
jgi:valyl-tRNA synthetase